MNFEVSICIFIAPPHQVILGAMRCEQQYNSNQEESGKCKNIKQSDAGCYIPALCLFLYLSLDKLSYNKVFPIIKCWG